MRRGEVLGIRWEDIDLEGMRLSVSQAVLNVAYKIEISDVKTQTSRRTVDLDPRTVAVLKAWRKTQLEERVALGLRPKDDSLVFAEPDGIAAPPRPVPPDVRPARRQRRRSRASASTTCATPTPRSC